MLADVILNVPAWTALALLVGAYFFLTRQRTPFPIINHHPRDLFGYKAHRQFFQNARDLVTRGLAQHQGPVTIAIPHRNKIILPSSLAPFVKAHKDLDHKELVKDDFFAGFPGFEAQTVLHSADEVIPAMIRAKLGQNDSLMEPMNKGIAEALHELWGDDASWHEIDWQKDTMGIITRAASPAFVGPEKASDPEWLELVQSYVLAYFTAVGQLSRYHPWLRPIAIWFLPNASACRRYVARARILMKDVLRIRQQETEKAEREGLATPIYNDALEWLRVDSKGAAEAGDVQLSLAMAAFFTTTELFRQILIEIARHPDLIGPLRDEVSRQISTHGISVAATYNMILLDSVMKESQRQSAGLVTLERKALKDVPLPDGTVIPRGTHIMVDSTNLWDPKVYPNPNEFDAHRFLHKRQAGDTSSQFVQSGPDYQVFGWGRHICPGRNFASNELKLTLAHILLKYDIRLAEGYESKSVSYGFYKVVDPVAQLEVRRRNEPVMDALL